MIPIYLCEDNETILTMQKNYLEKLILIENYDMELALCCVHPQEILAAIKTSPKRGIYFLDVELTNEPIDGFMLGQKIRKLDPEGFLIYVTAHKNLAFETFRYHLAAFDYIVKENPQTMLEQMRQNLTLITKQLCGAQSGIQKFFSLKVMDVIKHIPMDEILFFETTGRTHRIELHAACDRMNFIGSLHDLEKQLDERFLRIHRAYLVNTEQISELDLKHRELRMKNGEICLFSKNMKHILLERI